MLLEEHSADGSIRETAVFIAHWATAEMTAKVVQAVLNYINTNYDDVSDRFVEVDNWEHEGFCKAFSREKMAESAKKMWGEFEFPDSWLMKNLWTPAIITAPWFREFTKKRRPRRYHKLNSGGC